MPVRDRLGTISTDDAVAALFPTPGQPAVAPWRLALSTVFPCLEHRTDRQAADAVRDRLAWKYALRLERDAPGFDPTVRSEFRARLVEGHADQRLLDLLRERCREGGWLNGRGRQRTDSTPLLARLRSLNRTRCVAQTMVSIWHVLSEVAPEWVGAPVPMSGVEREGERLAHEPVPKDGQERTPDANQVGADGRLVLSAREASDAPDGMKTLAAVAPLRTVWAQQWESLDQGSAFRHEPAGPAAQMITSPSDPDARHAKKRIPSWTGDNGHGTPTGADEAPQLITHVETTLAPLRAEGVVSPIHAAFARTDLLPEPHLVASGDVTVAPLLPSQADGGGELVGPTRKTHWYQAETGSDLRHVCRDWEAEPVTDPQGQINSSWTPVPEAGKELIKITCSQSDGKGCPSQTWCPGSTRRTLPLSPKEPMQARFAARAREQTETFQDTSRHCAGIAGTHSQAVRAMGLRRSRSLGLRQTHPGHGAVATAINLVRLMRFLRGEAPAQTRTSPFKRLMKQAS